MSPIWVKFEHSHSPAVKVPISGCKDFTAVKNVVKKELPKYLNFDSITEITLHKTWNDKPFRSMAEL